MAGNLINTLYPPIADTFMPAFVNTTDGYVWFSLSPYNNADDINRIHISLVDQKTNKYAFADLVDGTDNGIFIVNGIMVRPFHSEDIIFDSESGLYKCPIERVFLKSEYRSDQGSTSAVYFKTEIWYQVQIRLDCSLETSIEDISAYMIDNRQYFSEWSRVILLRPIPQPLMYFNAWDDVILSADFSQMADKVKIMPGMNNKRRLTIVEEIIPSYNPGLIPIAGRIYWEQATTGSNSNTEYLDHYQITIFDAGETEVPIIDSGVIYVGNQEKDSIYFLADLTDGESNSNYIIHIDAVTRNGYAFWDERTISLALFNPTPFELEWEFTTIKLNAYGDVSDKIVTEEDGFVRCRIKSTTDMPPGYLYIYRTSSEDNYVKSSIIQVSKENGIIDTTFEDRTVCSLVQYRYKAQFKLKKGNTWTRVRRSPVYVYPDFYDMLILRQDKQLAIRYNEQLSSYKPIVNRVKIDTLGNKYPRFAENARMNYKSFQISGTITAEADFNRQFLNETDEEFAPGIEAYDDNIGNVWMIRNDSIIESTDKPILEGQHDLYLHNNWYWEREFREKAMAWLNDGEPKLYRSMTEGNIIVILTDINLTPNKTLGRMVFDFSATAYEIGDGKDFEEIKKFGIIIIRDDEAEDLKPQGGEGSGDESDYIQVERVHQYILGKGNNLATNMVSAVDLIKDQILRIDSNDGGWVDPITLWDYLNQYYTGVSSNRQLKKGSIALKNVRLQFTSKPRWIKIGDDRESASDGSYNSILNLVSDEELLHGNPGDADKYLFGYKFRVQTSNGVVRPIFVNEKGYYQVPSDLPVTAISFYYGDSFQLDYILTYKLEYNTSLLPSKTEKVRDVLGQYAGVYYPGVSMGETIRKKYSNIIYKDNKIESEESMASWSGIGFDVTPYAFFEILFEGDSTYEKRLVGRTGVYNLMTDFEVVDLQSLGRRMTKSRMDNRPYLDEWEYILDQSVTNEPEPFSSSYWYNFMTSPSQDIIVEPTENIVYLGLIGSGGTIDMREPTNRWTELDNINEEEELYGYLKIENIKNPQYNTVYKIVDKNGENPVFVLYYVDQGWYQVIFEKKNDEYDFSECIARVPIYGMINYRGTVIKKTYS